MICVVLARSGRMIQISNISHCLVPLTRVIIAKVPFLIHEIWILAVHFSCITQESRSGFVHSGLTLMVILLIWIVVHHLWLMAIVLIFIKMATATNALRPFTNIWISIREASSLVLFVRLSLKYICAIVCMQILHYLRLLKVLILVNSSLMTLTGASSRSREEVLGVSLVLLHQSIGITTVYLRKLCMTISELTLILLIIAMWILPWNHIFLPNTRIATSCGLRCLHSMHGVIHYVLVITLTHFIDFLFSLICKFGIFSSCFNNLWKIIFKRVRVWIFEYQRSNLAKKYLKDEI